MFASIRRHQKWLLFFIGGATIISFVWFFSPSSQFTPGTALSGSEAVGSIYGRPVTREAYMDAQREVYLRYYLNYRRWPDEDEMARQLNLVERETRSRLFLIEKLKDLDIKVGEEAVARWIADVFQDPDQRAFRKDVYDQFVTQVLPSRNLSRRDFERFVRNEVGIQHLNSVVGVPGRLITPQEAEAVYRRENQKVDTKVVLVSSSNFVSQVNLDPNALAEFYTNYQANYRIPERVQLSYVKIDATNFLEAATQRMAQESNKVEQIISAIYQQRGPDYYTGTNGQPLSVEVARERVRDEVRTRYALIEAQKKANELLEPLLETKPASIENLEKQAAAMGLQVDVTQPFSQFQQPPGLNLPEGIGQAAFRLTQEDPFFDQSIVTEDAVYVAGVKARLPMTQQPLDEVRDRVTADFRRREAAALADKAGAELQRNLSAAVSQGTAFDAAAASASATAQVVDLPPISQKTATVPALPPRADLNAIKNVAFTLSPGQVSDYTPASQEGGFIVYLEKKEPVTEQELQSALPEFTKTLQRTRQYEAFSDWLRKEMDQANIVMPGDQQTAAAQ